MRRTAVSSWLVVIVLCSLVVTACHPIDATGSPFGSGQDPDMLTEAQKASLLSMAEKVVAYLCDNDFNSVIDQFFSAELLKQYDAPKLEASWRALGRFQSSSSEGASYQKKKNHELVSLPLQMTNGAYILQMSVNPDREISGFYFIRSDANQTANDLDVLPPQDIVEREAVFEGQEGYPLSGTLSLPAQGKGPFPAVVLIHDSGPLDRNAQMGNLAPFRDIAHALAAEGIAVLRYDKITKAYELRMFDDHEMKYFNVDRETVLDAAAAVQWLREQPEIASDQVFLVGHGQGGMLAPYIAAKGADVAGMVIMAGSPRPRWQLLYDRNMDNLERMADAGYDVTANRLMMETEWERASRMDEMSWEEAADVSFFGSQGYYLKHWSEIDSADLLRKSGKPALILQAGKDEQMDGERELGAWRSMLAGHGAVAFQFYPELNHCFMLAVTDADTLPEEALTVQRGVTDTIRKWIEATLQ